MTGKRDIWAVVPVKTLASAKTRLAPQLSAATRQALARAMLEDVLDALAQAPTLAGIIVVTVDPLVATIASRHRATVVSDGADSGHTMAVMTAARRLQREGRSGMLTVPGDIPALCQDEVEALLALHGEAPAFTIAAAHDGRGSNAIVMSPPAAVPLAFGDDSFVPHITAARAAGIEPAIATGLHGIARDVDCYHDIEALLHIGRSVHTRNMLESR